MEMNNSRINSHKQCKVKKTTCTLSKYFLCFPSAAAAHTSRPSAATLSPPPGVCTRHMARSKSQQRRLRTLTHQPPTTAPALPPPRRVTDKCDKSELVLFCWTTSGQMDHGRRWIPHQPLCKHGAGGEGGPGWRRVGEEGRWGSHRPVRPSGGGSAEDDGGGGGLWGGRRWLIEFNAF